MALFKENGTIRRGKTNFDYLNLALPLKFDIFPSYPRDYFNIIFLSEVFDAEKRNIKSTVAWLDLDDCTFRKLFKDLKKKRISTWAMMKQKKFHRIIAPVIWKELWCECFILMYCIRLQKTETTNLDLSFFLKLMEILGYYRHINIKLLFPLVEMFYERIPEDYIVRQRILVEMKKAFLMTNEFKNAEFKFVSTALRLPFHHREDIQDQINELKSHLGCSNQSKVSKRLNVISDPRTLELLIRYGFTDYYLELELSASRGQIRVPAGISDSEAFQGSMGDMFSELNPVTVVQTEKASKRVDRRIEQVRYLYCYKIHPTGKPNRIDTFLNLLWETIPDPFLVREDFVSHVTKDKFESVAKAEYDWYAEVVSNKCSVNMPRSLKHLSRCAIRDRLADNLLLPEGVFTLQVKSYGILRKKMVPLPYPLQQYLLLN